MLDTKYVIKVACIWATILYVICFVGVALFSPLRSMFMEYALHTRMDVGVNSMSFVTFVAGLFFWNILTALGVGLFCFLFNSIRRRKDTKNDPIITQLVALVVGIMIGYLIAFANGSSDGLRYEHMKRSSSFIKDKGSSMMQMGRMMMDGGMMMKQRGNMHSDEEMKTKGRELEERGSMMDAQAQEMMRRGDDMMQMMK